MVEKVFIQEDEPIIAFDYMNVKPLGKASSGMLINVAIAVALQSGKIKVVDVYGNELLHVTVEGEIQAIGPSSSSDDMFLSVLTKSNKFYIFDIQLERKFNYQKDKFKKTQQENDNSSDQDHQQNNEEEELINLNKNESGSLSQEQYSKKYKKLLSMYDYQVKEPKIIDLEESLMNHGYGQYVEKNQFQQLVVYMNKGEKYFIFSDSLGYFTVLRRDGTFRSRFSSGFHEVGSLIKHTLSVLFTAQNKIGFVKFTESNVGQLFCDAGPYQITTATLDGTNTGILYAGTTSGEILIFESQNTVLRPDTVECRLIGKLETNFISNLGSQTKDQQLSNLYDLKALKGTLLAYTSQGIFEMFNTSSVYSLLLQQDMQPIEYIPKHQEDSKHPVTDVRMVETRIPNGNFVLIRVPGHENKLVLYECLIPFIRSESFLDSFNFKFPMFVIAFVFVIFYQIYKKRTAASDENESELVKKFGGGKRLNPKAKQDLQEIDRMMKELGGLSEGVKNFTTGAARR